MVNFLSEIDTRRSRKLSIDFTKEFQRRDNKNPRAEGGSERVFIKGGNLLSQGARPLAGKGMEPALRKISRE
jgi:hypothetical protein